MQKGEDRGLKTTITLDFGPNNHSKDWKSLIQLSRNQETILQGTSLVGSPKCLAAATLFHHQLMKEMF
jgi:hypothetical protein